MKTITIVVPSYNEEEVLETFYNEIIKHFDSNYNFYLLFVDDGSKDKTIDILRQLSQIDERVKYISFSRNFGKEAAVLAGLEGALELMSDAVVIIDADLQDPPYLIKDMIDYYEQGYMHIYAKHRTRKGEPWLKTFFAKAFYKVYSYLTNDKNMAQGARDFSLMDKKVVEAFIAMKDHKRFTKGISSWVGFEKKCIEFDYVPRVAGQTKWSFKKLFRYAMDGIRQFSHVYTLLTTFAIFMSVSILVGDVLIGIFRNSFNVRFYIIEFLIIFLFVVIHFLIKLLYDVRDQLLDRPKYITSETNIDHEDSNERI